MIRRKKGSTFIRKWLEEITAGNLDFSKVILPSSIKRLRKNEKFTF